MSEQAVAISHSLCNWLMQTSWQSAVLAGLIVLLMITVGRSMAPKWRCLTWLLVLARLAMPMVPHSRWSLFSLIDRHQTIQTVSPEPFSQTIVRVEYESAPGRSTQNTLPALIVPAAVPARPLDWRMMLVGAWWAGALLTLTRMLISRVRFARSIRHAACAGSEQAELFEQCAREMGFSVAPALRVSSAVSGPSVFGVIRPVVLLPRELLGEFSRRQLRFIFLHELAHIQRRDTLIECVAVIVGCIHWFNPVAYLALSRIRSERELACDQIVLGLSDAEDRTAYGHTVLFVASRVASTPAIALTMASRHSCIKRRIQMIGNYKASRFSALLGLLMIVLLASCTMTGAQSNPPSETKPESQPGQSNPVTARSPATQPAVDPLTKIIPSVKLNNVALGDALEFLRDVSGANLYVNWKSLESANISRDAPVSLSVNNITTGTALKLILTDAGKGELAFKVEDGVVMIAASKEMAAAVQMRKFDINDLLFSVPDLEGHSPENAISVPTSQPTREELCDELKKFITENVDAASWKDNGGDCGSISFYKGQMYVTQTEENLKKIEMLFEDIRKTNSKQVQVVTLFIELDPSSLPAGPTRDGVTMLLDGFARNVKPDKSQSWFLSDAEVDTILKAAEGHKKAAIITAPRLTLFDGQRASIMIMTQSRYIASQRAITPGPDGLKWAPVMDVAGDGVQLKVRANIASDQKSVYLALEPKFTVLEKLETVPFKPANGSDAQGTTIQIPKIWTNEVATSAAVPNGQTLLIGGMQTRPDADGAPTPVFMLVRPSIIKTTEQQAAK